MASGTATTAPSTATTAPTALPLMAGPSTPSTIYNRTYCSYCCVTYTPLFKRPGRSLVLNKRQCSLLPCLIRPCRISWSLPCLLLCQQGLTQWVIMVRAISSLLCLIPIGCLKESSCYNISSFRNCSSLKLGELAKPSLSLSPPLVHWGHQSRLRMMLMSASFRRPRPGDQATVKAPKRARSTSTSRRSISPSRDYPRGTSTATRPSQASPKRPEDRPAPAQDLEAFKAEMTSILSDMLHYLLSNLASQFKPSSGGQGDSVSTQNVASDQEKILSDTQGIPSLDSLRMNEEEERDFNTFSLVPVTGPKRSWRAQEDLKDSKSHSQAHDVSNTSQTRPVISQVVVQAQSTISVQSDQRSDQTQKSVQDQPVSQAHFQSWCLKVMVKVKVKAYQLWFGVMI